jgi:hypothetical protein
MCGKVGVIGYHLIARVRGYTVICQPLLRFNYSAVLIERERHSFPLDVYIRAANENK